MRVQFFGRAVSTVAMCAVLLSIAACSERAAGRPAEERDPRYRRQATSVEGRGPVSRRYTIRMHGGLDGSVNSPFGLVAWRRVFEPNLRVTIENTGDTPIDDAWLSVNGRPWRSVKDLYEQAVAGATSPQEKAIAIFQFVRQTFGAFPSAASYYPQPLELANSYGGSLCGPLNALAWKLWSMAGLPVRQVADAAHVNTEVMYEGRWHLFDVHYGFYPLVRGGSQIASAAEAMTRPERIQPIHMAGAVLGDRASDEKLARDWKVLFGQEPKAVPVVFPDADTSLSLPSGTRLVFDWGQPAGCLNQGQPDRMSACDPLIANGRLTYEPDLRKASHVKQLSSVQNLGVTADGLATRDATREARLGLAHEFPFDPFEGELRVTVEPRGGGPVRLQVLSSHVGDEWTLKAEREVSTRTEVVVRLSPRDFLARGGVPNFGSGVHVSIRLTGSAVVASYKMAITFQVGRSALPSLRLGDNEVVYQDRTNGSHTLRIVHEWLEDEHLQAPAPVVTPRYPADGATEVNRVPRLEWDNAATSGQASAYFLRVSERPDARWAVSSSVDRLIERADVAHPASSFQVPDGVLIPRRTYYWRVWTRDARGFWSVPGRVWRFTVK